MQSRTNPRIAFLLVRTRRSGFPKRGSLTTFHVMTKAPKQGIGVPNLQSSGSAGKPTFPRENIHLFKNVGSRQ